MASEFYVYENWTAKKKAVIHRADCGFCNDGRGVHRNVRGAANGRWHGPLASYPEASAFARRLEDRTVAACSFCNPADSRE